MSSSVSLSWNRVVAGLVLLDGAGLSVPTIRSCKRSIRPLATMRSATCCLGSPSGSDSATGIAMLATSPTVNSASCFTSFFLIFGVIVGSNARTVRSLSCKGNRSIGLVLMRS